MSYFRTRHERGKDDEIVTTTTEHIRGHLYLNSGGQNFHQYQQNEQLFLHLNR